MPDTNDTSQQVASETNEQLPPRINLPSKSADEFLERSKLELEIRMQLRTEYETLFKIWKNEDLSELEKKQDEVIAKGLKTYFDKWVEEQKPPEPADIQVLLNQEYETFTIPVNYVDYAEDGSETPHSMLFTIRELPQTIEKQFYRQFKGRIVGRLSDLEAITQAGMDQPFEKRVQSFLEVFDDGFDVLAEAVQLCLNPFGKKKEITREWIQNNISSDRQWRIVEAQMKVNRLRDFFSKVSTSGRNMMMMKRPNFQALQTLAA
jgi:hypothetical protein